jgi:hypothetical protein
VMNMRARNVTTASASSAQIIVEKISASLMSGRNYSKK